METSIPVTVKITAMITLKSQYHDYNNDFIDDSHDYDASHADDSNTNNYNNF